MAKVQAYSWPEFWALVVTLPLAAQAHVAEQLALRALLARLPPKGLVEVLGDAPGEVIQQTWPLLGLQAKIGLLKHWGVDVRRLRLTDAKQLPAPPKFTQERSLGRWE